MKFSLVIVPLRDESDDSWRRMIESIESQRFDRSEFECVICAGRYLTAFFSKLAQRGGVKIVECKERSSIKRRNAGIEQSLGEVIIFIEEPMLLPDDYLLEFSQIFQDAIIGAAHSRIVEHRELASTLQYPSRAGLPRLLRVPILDGRICAIRRVLCLRIGPFESSCGALSWGDFTWRLLFYPAVVCSTSKVTAVSLRTPNSGIGRLGAAFAAGAQCAVFMVRWRDVLASRWKRITAQMRKRALIRCGDAARLYSDRLIGAAARELFYEVISFLAFMTCLPIALLNRRKVMLVRAADDLINPWTYYFCDDDFLYAGRICVSDDTYLHGTARTIVRELIHSAGSDEASNVLAAGAYENMNSDSTAAMRLLIKANVFAQGQAA